MKKLIEPGQFRGQSTHDGRYQYITILPESQPICVPLSHGPACESGGYPCRETACRSRLPGPLNPQVRAPAPGLKCIDKTGVALPYFAKKEKIFLREEGNTKDIEDI